MTWEGSRSWMVSKAADGPGLRLTADPGVVLDCFLTDASNELDIPLMRRDATAAPARGAVVQVLGLTSTICHGIALRRHFEYPSGVVTTFTPWSKWKPTTLVGWFDARFTLDRDMGNRLCAGDRWQSPLNALELVVSSASALPDGELIVPSGSGTARSLDDVEPLL